tara:strand:- start:4210 stop:4773 length:564 start_codon:yes stop_codon:yes gene_type:complete
MKEAIEKAVEALNSGKTILYPSDSIWGVGCDATNQEAVEKIFQLKDRDNSKSLIVLVADDAMLNKFLKDVPPVAWDLIDASDQPLTIIYPEGRNLAKGVIAADGTVAIRMVKDQFCNQLIRRFRKPIVSTSANFSNAPTPLSYTDISAEFKAKVNYEVDLPQQKDQTGKPSSIIKLSMNGEIQLIRK